MVTDMDEVYPQIIEGLSRYREGVEAVVPLVQGYPQPLAAFYAKNSQEGCEDEMDGTQAINLFRITQESLTNVVRHSGATKVAVSLRRDNEEVVLSISDNGRGLPEGHTIASTSYGLRGMRERVAQLGGKIKFDNPPGGGFSVTVRLPVAAVTE